MEPKDPKVTRDTTDDNDVDESEEETETRTDAFGNEAEHLWWVPMEFVHEFEDGDKVRFRFRLLVAGSDEAQARENAESIAMDEIVDDNPDFDGLCADEISDALDDNLYVCEIDRETLPDDADVCSLEVNYEELVEEDDRTRWGR